VKSKDEVQKIARTLMNSSIIERDSILSYVNLLYYIYLNED